MKAGDRVKLIGIPTDLKDDEELHTRSLFEKCLGKTFLIADMVTVEGLSRQLAKLDVGHVLGKPAYMDSITVEQEFLQVEDSD